MHKHVISHLCITRTVICSWNYCGVDVSSFTRHAFNLVSRIVHLWKLNDTSHSVMYIQTQLIRKYIHTLFYFLSEPWSSSLSKTPITWTWTDHFYLFEVFISIIWKSGTAHGKLHRAKNDGSSQTKENMKSSHSMYLQGETKLWYMTDGFLHVEDDGQNILLIFKFFCPPLNQNGKWAYEIQ